MKFKRAVKADEEGLPITNLVDVLFLLIVFFMVSTVLSFDRGIGVLLGIVRQQLQRVQHTIGRAADHIGEGATAVDPELHRGRKSANRGLGRRAAGIFRSGAPQREAHDRTSSR